MQRFLTLFVLAGLALGIAVGYVLHQQQPSSAWPEIAANFKLVTWFGDGSSPFGCRTLHSVWDDAIIRRRGLGEGDFTNHLDKLSPADMAAFQKGDVVSWVNQAVKLAVTNAYGLLPERDEPGTP